MSNQADRQEPRNCIHLQTPEDIAKAHQFGQASIVFRPSEPPDQRFAYWLCKECLHSGAKEIKEAPAEQKSAVRNQVWLRLFGVPFDVR